MLQFLKNVFARTLPQEMTGIVVPRDDAPSLFARTFASDDGQKVLSYLRATVNARVGGPEAGESALRYYDGQRGLLQTINGLIDQGK